MGFLKVLIALMALHARVPCRQHRRSRGNSRRPPSRDRTMPEIVEGEVLYARRLLRLPEVVLKLEFIDGLTVQSEH